MRPEGIFPALVTPFNADESVSLTAVRDNIRLYNQTRIAGYVVLGSTGESVMLSRDEADAVLSAVREVASSEKILIAGTGAESTAETIVRTKRAAALGYQFALVKTPYYYKPVYRAETFLRHYRAVADASPIPVLLYSVPQFTGITLETSEIVALAAHPNILGIKDSSGNIQRVGEIVANAPPDFTVLTGGAAVIYPALAIGGRGAILALAAALPEKCAEVFELFETDRHEEARHLQLLLVQASRRIVGEHGIPGVKFAMDLRGYSGGVSRLPLLPLTEEKKQSIAGIVAQLYPAAARV
ncbi:MAG TPA: dihydrodipicolinate synthase family protein [Candidatus Saccharimonadales bacterium]|nr:dihydrodipicolinate synthase family protein [Candidatus Saccharimonadales bacterium]